MRQGLRSPWILLGALVVIVLVLFALSGSGAPASSPEHSSDSDARDGTSALRQYAAALGHPVTTQVQDFILPAGGMMFVFTPTQGFTSEEAGRVRDWVGAGGTLIYANEDPDPMLDPALGLTRHLSSSTSGSAQAIDPLLPGVRSVAGGTRVFPLESSPTQTPLLRSGDGSVVGLRALMGKGQIFWLADPLELCNDFLGKKDNGRLAADLLAAAPGAPVVFDEFHHGAAGTVEPFAWLGSLWARSLMWATAVIFLGLAWRGRGFGPPISLRDRPDRSTAEHTRAVGRLLQLSGGRALTARVLLDSTRRALAERAGLGRESARPDFDAVLAQRAPDLAIRFTQAKGTMVPVETSERALVEMARRLHTLAYPVEEIKKK